MLRDFRLFKDLPEADCQRLAGYFQKINFKKKQQIEFPGAGQDYIYLVCSGRVKVSYLSSEGKEVIVTVLHPGDIYSLHSEASTTVLEPAEIWYMGSNDFKEMVMQNPGLTVNLIRILGTILKNTNEALLNLAFKEVNSRLATLLLRAAKEGGVATREGISLELGLTHEEIANSISSTRQTVTTILNRLEKSGLIEVNKRRIIIKDLQKLAELSI